MFCAADDASHFHMASINYTLNGYPNGFAGDLAAAHGYALRCRRNVTPERVTVGLHSSFCDVRRERLTLSLQDHPHPCLATATPVCPPPIRTALCRKPGSVTPDVR